MAVIADKKTPRYYTVAWRWHFYAGLLVAPFMIMLAITGMIYLFKPQLDQLMYGNLLNVPAASTQAHPADHLVAAVKAQYPGASVLGALDENNNLQTIVLKLHGELLIGKNGDLLVELATSWTLVLLVSGLYLWWPRGRGKLAVFWPRLNAGGRAFWRDIHAVTGFWGAIFLLFMLLSGLTWTGYWGEKFAAVWSQFPAQMWDDVPKSDKKALSLNSTAEKIVPWAVEPSPLPKSTDPHAAHKGAAPQAATPQIALQQVVDTG